MAYNPGTNIVVSGKTFMDVPSVQFKTPDGATVNFAHVGGQIRFSPTLEEQTEDVANYQDVIINPITSTLLNQLDSDFIAENIKKDVDLFGLLGTLEAGGGSSWTDNYSVFATGTFTPTENTTELSIDTGIPFDSAGGTDYRRQILIGYCEPSTGYSGQAGLLVFLWRAIGAKFDGANVVFGALGFPSGITASKFIKGSNLPFPNEGETIWNISGLSTTTNFRNNRIYRWMLLGALK